MKFAILGSGNGARAWSAQIAAKGHRAVMWEPLEGSADFSKLKEAKTIHLKGDIELTGTLEAVTMDIAEAMKGAQVVGVIVPAFAHEPIFRKMIPHLADGQKVVIVPGNYGEYRLKKMMREAGCKKKISVSTVETMPYACRIAEFDVVNIYKRKFVVHLASAPMKDNPETMDILNDVFAGYIKFEAASHVLEQNLSNCNYVLHPYPVILNYGDIEKHPDTFRHYMDGITPLVGEQMDLLDKERIELGGKLGFRLTPVLDMLKLYYGHNDTKNIYEYVNSPENPYADIVGHNVRSRYVTEDVPMVIMPAVELGRKAGFDAPRGRVIVDWLSQLHKTDYWASGTTLASIGLADKTINEILEIAGE